MLTRWDLIISQFPKTAFSGGKKKKILNDLTASKMVEMVFSSTTKYCAPFVVILISETAWRDKSQRT